TAGRLSRRDVRRPPKGCQTGHIRGPGGGSGAGSVADGPRTPGAGRPRADARTPQDGERSSRRVALGPDRLAAGRGPRPRPRPAVVSPLWPELSARLLSRTPTAHWLEYADLIPPAKAGSDDRQFVIAEGRS